MAREDPFLILLVEDNPGDARLIREMFQDAVESPDRILQDETGLEGDTHRLLHEERLSAALETLAAETVDVVLLDLNLPDSRGLDTLSTAREAAPSVPILVLTGLADRDIGVRALKRGAEEFLVKDEINANLLVRSVYHALERARYERELEQQRDQLAALNQLNTIVRDINHALVEQSTRGDIERIACERLADSDAYEFAWIGAVDAPTGQLSVRCEAGVEGCLDSITVAVDGEGTDGTGETDGPVDKAVRSRSMQASGAVPDGADPWRTHARELGYRAIAAVPITYEKRTYGVLAVHSDRGDAFDGPEGDIVGQLGEIIGHAINSIERKEALMAEQLVQLEFRSEDLAEPFADAMEDEAGTITVDRTIPLEDGAALQYYSTTGVPPEAFEQELERWPSVTYVRLLTQSNDEARFQVRTTGDTIASVFAGYGGHHRSVRIENGESRVVAALPDSIDVSSVVSAVQSMYPDMELVSKETVDERESADRGPGVRIGGNLTDRQRTVLETAFFAGYYDWPRGSTAEEIAESLGIAAPTFHELLRAAERKLLLELLEERPLAARR